MIGSKQTLIATSTLSGLLILSACSSPTPHAAAEAKPSEYSDAGSSRMSPPMSPLPVAAKMAYGNSYVAMPQERAPIPVVDTEKYGKLDTNPVHETNKEPVSTFSIDVDTGSYSNTRRFLNSGRLPPADAVRVEEMINYFPYQYALPKDKHPFGVTTEISDSPWNKNAQIIRIGIKASDVKVESLPPANLVLLVDVSGSMYSEDKLPLVKKTLRQLTKQLREQDRISIVTYSGATQVALPPTSGADKEKILEVINRLDASGGTAGGAGLKLAYEQAEKSFIKNGINRILLATDGDFNLGVTSFDTLKSMVAEKRKSGISLSTFGYGVGNYNEHLMEQVADAGNGNYSYIDNEREAKKVLGEQLSSTLSIVASDVKIQMEFNPKTVSEYRLIGYENRLLKKEDFNNDQVDAGEIGAGHTVTALYEIIPAGKQGWNTPSRYQDNNIDKSKYGNEYAFLRIRYKPVGKQESVLLENPVVKTEGKSVQAASEDMRFALAVASYGQMLRNGQYTGTYTWADVLKLAKGSVGKDPYGLRNEFVELVETAQSLSSKQPK